METALEVVKVAVTFAVSFLFALVPGRLCLLGFFQGALSARPVVKVRQDWKRPLSPRPTV